jgi:hypothetical protein
LVAEYVAHYNGERPHQGKRNVRLSGAAWPETGRVKTGEIGCVEQSSGLLKQYLRRAGLAPVLLDARTKRRCMSPRLAAGRSSARTSVADRLRPLPIMIRDLKVSETAHSVSPRPGACYPRRECLPARTSRETESSAS